LTNEINTRGTSVELYTRPVSMCYHGHPQNTLYSGAKVRHDQGTKRTKPGTMGWNFGVWVWQLCP